MAIPKLHWACWQPPCLCSQLTACFFEDSYGPASSSFAAYGACRQAARVRQLHFWCIASTIQLQGT
eukprot:scaffold112611_cov20-Tisochrysis_lutea.AAC.5